MKIRRLDKMKSKTRKGLSFGVILMTIVVTLSIATPVAASTGVPDGDVSGTWALAGSPYLIQGDVAVPAGIETANGWYEGEEIYYANLGVEEGVTERGENDIYLIGGDRLFQAQVVEFIPGEPGYSPHWNAHLVNTAEGVTVGDILDSPYASELEDVLFDDVEDILAAEDANLVTVTRLGVVVLCPIISEEGAEAPGNTELGLTEPFPDDNEGF
jgi:hypothetical protein